MQKSNLFYFCAFRYFAILAAALHIGYCIAGQKRNRAKEGTSAHLCTLLYVRIQLIHACTEQSPHGTGGSHLCTLLYVRIQLIPCLHWTATTRHRRLSPHSSRTDCTQQQQQACIIISSHRRRIYTEENVKVVVAAWGTELLQFLAALAILHQGELNNRMICTLFFNSYWCKIAIAARKWSRKQRRPFPFLLCKSFFYCTVISTQCDNNYNLEIFKFFLCISSLLTAVFSPKNVYWRILSWYP